MSDPVISFGATDKEAADKLQFNEYGTATIPARAPIRRTVRSGIIQKTMAKEWGKFLKTNDFDSLIDSIGTATVIAIKTGIDQGKFTPRNAPSTAKIKGHSKPLLDTGELRDAINFEVTK